MKFVHFNMNVYTRISFNTSRHCIQHPQTKQWLDGDLTKSLIMEVCLYLQFLKWIYVLSFFYFRFSIV